MEVPQKALQDGLGHSGADVVLLDVHVEDVQQHLGAGMVQRPAEVHGLPGGVEQIVLKAVDDLEAEVDIQFLRDGQDPPHLLLTAQQRALLFLHGERPLGFAGPGGMDQTVPLVRPQLMQLGHDAERVLEARLADRRVRAGGDLPAPQIRSISQSAISSFSSARPSGLRASRWTGMTSSACPPAAWMCLSAATASISSGVPRK